MKSHLESLLVIVIQSYLASVLYGCNMCLLFQQFPISYLNMSPLCRHNRHSPIREAVFSLFDCTFKQTRVGKILGDYELRPLLCARNPPVVAS